ncbi:MAG: DNA polymerase ligase N-terminal domain-containing protein [bacterium]
MSKKKPIFVIHKHGATRLHYDFRLEIDGVLKSWAVPKGPSTDPAQKRLAVMVDDHEFEYAKFEGVIPKGQYGAGPVMIWDKGTYKNIKGKDGKSVPIKTCISRGQIEIWLEGKKLKGGYALIHMNNLYNIICHGNTNHNVMIHTPRKGIGSSFY